MWWYLSLDFFLEEERVAHAVDEYLDGLGHVALERVIAVDHLLPGTGGTNVASSKLELMHEIAVRAVVGVLEGHLLQQVGHAGGLGGLVNRAGVNKETDARGRTLRRAELQTIPTATEKLKMKRGAAQRMCLGALPGRLRWRRGCRWGAW